jgi:putative oxidoreductase
MALPIRRDSVVAIPQEKPGLMPAHGPAPVQATRPSQLVLTGLRTIAGLMFMEHGVQKLFGLLIDPNRPPMPMPSMFSQLWFAGVLETFGGALIVLGLFTRPVAFLLAGEMAVAYFTVHFPKSFWPILSGGEPAVLYCWIFLAFATIGAGPYSVDGLRRRRSQPMAGAKFPSSSSPSRPGLSRSADAW